MQDRQIVALQPITPSDVLAVGEFLHAEMNARVSAVAWADAMMPPWFVDQPNHGFMLRHDNRIVGVYLALYSDRVIGGETFRFCNLAAWCVLEEHRPHSLRLLRSLLAQPGYQFTDLSPSGNVVPLNTRLKFTSLDTSTALVANIPWPIGTTGVRVVSAPAEIDSTLVGSDHEIYRDHVRTAAARHIVVVRGDEICYVMFRRDRRKKMPLFASILYVSNPALFSSTARHVFRHLLTRHAIPATLAELRVVGRRPNASIMLKSPRPKMYRSATLRPEQIDYLYSELACVAW